MSKILFPLGLCPKVCFRHNEQPFSKFAFLANKYDTWNLGNLSIVNTRDFSMFMALDSAGLGVNREIALEKFKQEMKGRTIEEYCSKTKRV